MDSVLNLLKQEINTTIDSVHDLAKWKLGVTAALGAVTLGLAKDSRPNYWLLLLVPFVCAYVDLYAYQYELRIRVIARFLRDYTTEGDALLQTYELECEKWRGQHIFSLGNWAGIGCSLGASAIGPVFYVLQRIHSAGLRSLVASHKAAGMVWVLGACLIGFLYWYFQRQARKLSGESASKQTAAAPQEPSAPPYD